MIDDPKRVPDDPRIRLAYSGPPPRDVPVIGTLNVDDELPPAQLRALRKAFQLQKLHDGVALLQLTATPVGASFVLGAARGRLAAMHDLGLVSDQEFTALKTTVRETFNRRWPDLQISDSPELNG